jgi:hypothetical protein
VTSAGWDEIRSAVIEGASGRCQCTGLCGRPHVRLGEGRCEAEDSILAPLHAVPRDLAAPPGRAVRLPAAGLVALCDRCHELALRIADRARQAARPADPGPALWELP